jgi:hypothetical protein
MSKFGLSGLTITWFLLTSIIVSIDLVYVLTRPNDASTRHPLASNYVFAQWEYYSTFDKRYAVNDDPFVVVQSLCNAVEVVLQLTAVLLHAAGKYTTANTLALVVAVMTLYKTIMYGMMEHFEGGKYTKHNSTADLIQMVVIPSSFWIIIPGMIVAQSWRRVTSGVSTAKAVLKQQKSK